MPDPALASKEFDLLHAARVRGVVPKTPETTALADEGHLREIARGMVLTPSGLQRHAALVEQERAQIDREALERSYSRFLAVNATVKHVCSSWQMSAADEDALFTAYMELDGYLQRVAPALELAASVLPRFGEHRRRMGLALAEAMAGDPRYISDPIVPSFHTVWFECHEDYIVSLGRTREEEEG